ncbi:MAG: hypothetical protein QOC88_1516 [Mycobacterium sp.]|jgi:hypothetical protein|nr:hypothetical protein [Mycobacterium sp.]
MQKTLRPHAAAGVALAAASLVVVAPLAAQVIQGPTAPNATAAVELAAGETDLLQGLDSTGLLAELQATGLPQLIGGNFDFTTVDGVQNYVNDASTWLLSNGQTAVNWGETIDPLISPAGISGFGGWLSDEYGLFSPMLAPDWDPATWLAGVYPDDPGAFFQPMADFNLGWLYSLLGAPEEATAPLNQLLDLESSLISGDINELLVALVAPVGLTEQVLAGNLDLQDPATLLALETGTWTDFVQPTVDSLNGSIQTITDTLQALDMGGLLGALF